MLQYISSTFATPYDMLYIAEFSACYHFNTLLNEQGCVTGALAVEGVQLLQEVPEIRLTQLRAQTRHRHRQLLPTDLRPSRQRRICLTAVKQWSDATVRLHRRWLLPTDLRPS